MSDCTPFFLKRCIELARQMPVQESARFLQGLCEALGEIEEAEKIRTAYVHLDESDRQLQLLVDPGSKFSGTH